MTMWSSESAFTHKMAFGADISDQTDPHEPFQNDHDVERVLDTCIRKDGRYYKVCWRDSWEREDCLVACERLIKKFWEQLEQKNPEKLEPDRCNSIERNGLPSPRVNGILHTHKSSSPTNSSGRRKGRPKKLVNHVVLSPKSHDEDSLQDHTRKRNKHSPNINSTGDKSTTYEKEMLCVQIPENNNIPNSKNNMIEEYPVMIIAENGIGDISEPLAAEYPVMIIAENGIGDIAEPLAAEYPVMIIAENGIGDIAEPLAAMQAVGVEANSPNSTADSAKMHVNEELSKKKPRLSEESPRISNIKSMIPNKDINHPRIKYTVPMVSSSEDRKISPAYVNNHHNLAPVVVTHNGFSVIKPTEGYTVSEGIPIVYESRSNHIRNDNNIPSHIIVADPRTTVKLKNGTTMFSEPVRISPDTKLQTSQLLLKVTGPSVTHGTTFITHSQAPQQQFPVYQAPAVVANTKTRSKEDVKICKGTTTYQTTADGEQRPQCPECFQTFKKRAALERHMMIHRGIKPFQCHFCNQRFRQKHHLQGHIMLHTGERPHSCTLCNKRFRMRHHLLEHERISHKVFR